MNILEITLIIIMLLMIFRVIILCISVFRECKLNENKKVLKEYNKPVLKTLTKEQIEDIHSRGKITPEEKVKEWESLDLCAPGDAIGSAGWRCKKFRYNCHDCLVDYAKQQDEYESFYKDLKLRNSRIKDT